MIKYFSILFFFITSTININAQTESEIDQKPEKVTNASLTVGLLQGGGSLVGIDLEALLTEQFGIQVGAGLLGYGAGLNFHIEPSIRSSFFSMQYWHQGVGDTYVQSVLGPTFVYRSKKWFTFQVGIGMPLEIGPGAPDDYVQPPIMLLYSIGGYFPI